MTGDADIIIEFYRVGAYVKVSAFDSRSLTEVSIVGDPSRGEAALRQAAIRKLQYVMARKQGQGPGAPKRGVQPAG